MGSRQIAFTLIIIYLFSCLFLSFVPQPGIMENSSFDIDQSNSLFEVIEHNLLNKEDAIPDEDEATVAATDMKIFSITQQELSIVIPQKKFSRTQIIKDLQARSLFTMDVCSPPPKV